MLNVFLVADGRRIVPRSHIRRVRVQAGRTADHSSQHRRLLAAAAAIRRRAARVRRTRLVTVVHWPVQRRRCAHVQHAATQDQYRAVETEVVHQMLDQHRKDEAAGGSAGHTDAVRQGAMLVEVQRHDDDAGRGRQAATDSCYNTT